jgi:myo-inositol catabolism protein IolC
MTKGYTKPLYILPFDHRESYVSGLFGWHEPLTEAQTQKVAASKEIIYQGFQQAIADGIPQENAGILVDEEFGATILRDARKHNYITAYSVEKSGQAEFDFEYGNDFARHIEAFDPTFAKVLVRYNPEGDKNINQRQAERLQRLSDYLQQTQRLFMFELLVPPEEAQLARVNKNKHRYDLELRPALVIQAIQELQDAGVDPDVWKIEGLERQEDCEKIVQVARRDQRDTVSLIVLGRGADQERVIHWLEVAAPVEGFIGFAVGRTSFLQQVKNYLAQNITAEEASSRIAEQFTDWVQIFTAARHGHKVG